MKIHQLRLRNWRGVAESELTLADGVTVVEGPNEVGKSSLVEAIGLLFSELDSSKKKDIQAIKPVDQDVGSEVSAEITAGPYRFHYSKTFNKTPSTVLKLASPRPLQMTGREAHQEVERMLQETVDMTLWRALLIKQGDSPTGADLRESGSLLKALDEAAGSSGNSDENPDLFGAVQEEYWRYFSPKSGKPRFQAELDRCHQAKQRVAAAGDSLAEVQQQVSEQERCLTEVNRLKAELPTLTAEKTRHEQHWQALESVQQSLQMQQSLLSSAQQMADQLRAELDARRRSAADIVQAEKNLADLRQAAAPAQTAVQSAQQTLNKLKQQLSEGVSDLKTARGWLQTAEADHAHLGIVQRLKDNKKRLSKIEQIQQQLELAVKQLDDIQVTDPLLQAFQQAEQDEQVLRRQLNAAATSINIQALTDLELSLGQQTLKLQSGQHHEQSIDQLMELELSQQLRVTLTPPATTQSVREQLRAAQDLLNELQQKCQAKTAAEAAGLNLRRHQQRQTINGLKTEQQALLDQDSPLEIAQRVESDTQLVSRYVARRSASEPLPESINEGAKQLRQAQIRWQQRDDFVDGLRSELQQAEDDYQASQGAMAEQRRQLELEQSLLHSRKQDLAAVQAMETDEALGQRSAAAVAALAQQQSTVVSLETKLAEQSPDSARLLMENASRVLDDARARLTERERDLAVADDRLQSARADGRFETFDAAQREQLQIEREVHALVRRAEAARLLFQTLSQCREQSRLAYVEPLKTAIDGLGQIVFGPGFSVHVTDDWSVSERILDGKTLPVSSLSIGAQEQLGLLGRLAAAQIVSTQGGVPLIIDDALGFSDPQRLKTLGAAIAAAGKKSQIIILTCTPGRFQHVGGASFVSLS